MRTRDRVLTALVGVLVTGGFSTVAAFLHDGPADVLSTVIAVISGIATVTLGFLAFAQAMGDDAEEP